MVKTCQILLNPTSLTLKPRSPSPSAWVAGTPGRYLRELWPRQGMVQIVLPQRHRCRGPSDLRVFAVEISASPQPLLCILGKVRRLSSFHWPDPWTIAHQTPTQGSVWVLVPSPIEDNIQLKPFIRMNAFQGASGSSPASSTNYLIWPGVTHPAFQPTKALQKVYILV